MGGYLFSKKIKCKNCLKNYKGVNERGKLKYLCSGYANYRTCERYIVEEEKLLSLIKNHTEIQMVKNGIGLGSVNRRSKKKKEEKLEDEIDNKALANYVKEIVVDPINDNLIIHYQDGTETFVSANVLKF